MAFGDQTKRALDGKIAGLQMLADNIGKTMESKAKKNAPWTDRTSNTRRAIHGGGESSANGATIFLEHGSKVGWYMEEGTGIHGPKRRPIVPRNASAMRFTIGGGMIFAKQTDGMPAQPIIEPTVKAQLPHIERQVREYWKS